MAFEVSLKNLSALQPLFKPWEEPLSHRIRNESVQGGPALVEPGRRPSRCPLVRGIRGEVDSWRKGGYSGVSNTSRHLLNYWFSEDHEVLDDDENKIDFKYHWAQREAIESIIYLFEVHKISNVAELMFEFGNDSIADIALGIDPKEDRWAKNCCKIATGGGKTKVMSLAIVWSYFHKFYESDSNLAQHFLIIAPNLTVYERLKEDFADRKIFDKDPLIPEEWKSDFQIQVILQDEPGGSSAKGTIYLTNIHRLYEGRDNNNTEEEYSILGPSVKKQKALNTSESLRERIAVHKSIMVLNDEAHHLHDPELAWNKAINSINDQSINRGNDGICIQLDFTATPKHNDGNLFRHIICDFPLGEAVDAGIVKVPLIGESNKLQWEEKRDPKISASKHYEMNLKLGYERYAATFEEFEKTRKPLMFVMTEDTKSADEITVYLNSDKFPLLKGRVLNLHINLKGKIKKVKRYGQEIIEFVEDEKDIKPEDLRILRELSRELDSKDSKYRCVVSVLMLREGWDIRNVTTIVPLRPYSAKSGILPEQTLGRGLRRMFPNQDVAESVITIHHPAFKKLYENELSQEGVDIAFCDLHESIKQTVTIFVDYKNKPVEDLEIEIPLISDSISVTHELENLDFNEIKSFFLKKFSPLPIGKKRQEKLDYEERHLFTNEVIAKMKFDGGLLANTWSAIDYFVKELSRACHLTNVHQILKPILQRFISEVLFERKIDIYSNEVDHRMRDLDVMEHIRATFTPILLSKTVKQESRKLLSKGVRLSAWKSYQATSNEKRPALPFKKTMFNLTPCANDYESAFSDFLDYCEEVFSFAKNSGPQSLMIDYLKPDGHKGHYIPDFFVRNSNNEYLLIELKGREDSSVVNKANAANEWCKSASKGKEKWRYLYSPYSIFQQGNFSSLEELYRACQPSLNKLIEEFKTKQQPLELEYTDETEERYTQFAKNIGVSNIPKIIEDNIRTSIKFINFAQKSSINIYSNGFQHLLSLFDSLAVQILENYLKPEIPKDVSKQSSFFNPILDYLQIRDKKEYEKYQRFLVSNLIYGHSVQKIDTFRFCLRHAKNGKDRLGGIWDAVKKVFKIKESVDVLDDLESAYAFRNKYIAHGDHPLTDINEAWSGLELWFKCLIKLDQLVN